MYNDFYTSPHIKRNHSLNTHPLYAAQEMAPLSNTKKNFITDYGPNPFVTDIHKAALQNDNYRTALWTGNHLQLTTMSIPVDSDIGLEVHPDTDQFLRIEEGTGIAHMGDSKDNLYINVPVYDDSAIFIPAGTWHNVVNTGQKPLKLYSIYAPPHHPHGTIHTTKSVAEQMGD